MLRQEYRAKEIIDIKKYSSINKVKKLREIVCCDIILRATMLHYKNKLFKD